MSTDNTLATLKRKLARWELEHLRRHAADLAERLERAEQDRDYYRQILDDEWEEKLRLFKELEDQGAELGIGLTGTLAVLIPPRAE
jgi:hypothetical protein